MCVQEYWQNTAGSDGKAQTAAAGTGCTMTDRQSPLPEWGLVGEDAIQGKDLYAIGKDLDDWYPQDGQLS